MEGNRETITRSNKLMQRDREGEREREIGYVKGEVRSKEVKRER